MGQGGSKTSSTEPTVKKTSYYELLGVERTATDDELKKAYRVRALALHPDRNFGNEDEATSLFAEIQAAYEVLSDPQDRAWYDTYELAAAESNEDGFKRTTTTGRSGRDQPDILNAGDLTTFFGEYHGVKRASLRTDETFWTGVATLFDRLAREETNAAIIAGERDTAPAYPSLGSPLSNSEDDYEITAKPFYSAWSGFATRKTFAWMDRWDEEEGEDRRMRRAIEKENKKGRETQIREYNTAVRMLVAFLKKCDPRVEERNAGMASPEEAERIARERVNEQKKRAREANEAKLQEAMKNRHKAPAWDTNRPEEERLYSDESEDEEDDETEHFECVACDKFFKSAKQYEAHEKSKKHKKAVWELRKFMVKEDVDLHLGGQTESYTTTPQNEANEDHKVELPIEDHAKPNATVTEAIEDLNLDPVASQPDSEAGSEEADDQENDKDDDSLHPDQLRNPTSSSAVPKLGKAAQKRARKAAQKTTVADQDGPTDLLGFKCVKCNAAFSSRSRLFDHIKELGHAAPVEDVGKKKTKKKGRR